ncbi:T9SS type A sorting domain-containing protein [Hymenobacter gummosus]|uniref:T9SS type A sorting domain-containing protein n=1 Tax=Hymenobacter gummosus TaxID=1776032 RepID=A0A3S0IRU3_9BACT|nr:FG-GAP-like repeat-containing protein [Hymenobacter gummosus]RTQ53384.1 T9SS type A sorting domain-containing protein [Hymenobacter gummosus]
MIHVFTPSSFSGPILTACRRAAALVLLGLGLASAAQAQFTVVSRQPARHAVAAPRAGGITVGFSQAVSAPTAANLRVYGSLLRGRRPGSFSGGGTATLTFTPAQAFAPGEVLSLSLPPTISSTGGTALSRQVYQFTAATGGAGRGFFLDTTIVGNTRNRDQALADLDGDGDLDLVTTGALFGCRVFLNDGQGHYRFKTGLVTGPEPKGLTLGDVDLDGDLDLLVDDADDNTVTVCLNDGTGEFVDAISGAQNAPVGNGPVGVALGDVDGDGDLDFATANAGGASSTIRLNNGSGLFTTLLTVSMGPSPTAVALADIDNDGDLDLLTSNAGSGSNPSGSVSVSRNNGTGGFGIYTSYSVGLNPTELVLADVDADGDLDLLTANTDAASVSLRLNNGSGTFGATTTLALPAGSTPTGLRAGDVDADGDLDLVVAQGSGGRIITFLNTNGTFTAQNRALRLSRDPNAPLTSTGVVLGDVDGDQDLDLITADNMGNVLLSLNQGPPAPLPAPVITALNPASGPVGATVLINGTNLTDVTAVRFNGTAASGFVLRNAGTEVEVVVPAGASTGPLTVVTEDAGMATSPTPFTITIPVPVLLTGITPARNALAVPVGANVVPTFTVPITAATADNLRVFGSLRRGRRPGTVAGAGTATLTFDPAQDFAPGELVSVVLPGSLQTFDGNRVTKQVVQFTAAAGGTGRHDFFLTSTFPLTRQGGFQLGDLDNDGDLDVAAPAGAAGVQLLLNNGSGTFAAAPALATSPTDADYLTLGDIDGDGDLDLISGATNGLGAAWRNDGTGRFSSAGPLTIGANLRKLLLTDADADGDMDLVAVAGSQISLLLNAGNGSFPVKRDLYPGVTPRDVAVGDLDGDGDLDLATVGPNVNGQYTAVLLLNDGASTFPATTTLVLSYDPTSRLALGDLDADGDLDLALLTFINSQYSLLTRTNDGTGRFSPGITQPVVGGVFALADSDADGDLDVVTPGCVALNSGRGLFSQVVTTTSPGPIGAAQVQLGDVDGDGDLDMLSDDQTGAVRVKLNRPGPPPTLTSVTPGSGHIGSQVLLTGGYLKTATSVAFNGVAAPAFTALSGTQLIATVPAGASTGAVTVTTPAGTATTPTPFTVFQPVAVTGLQPLRHTINAPRSTAVSVTFAQPISAATAGELRVFSPRRGRLAGSVTGAGTSTLTFTPAQALAPGDALSVSIPDGLTAATGNRVQRQTAQFTTAAGGPGTGRFLPSAHAGPYAGYEVRHGLAVGDLDGDGDLDVITSSGSLRFNNGTGVFADSVDFPLFAPTAEPRRLAVGDLDGDGDLDVLTSNGQLALNDNQWQTTPVTSTPGLGADFRDLALGDVDSDGDLDFVAANYARDTVVVGLNDGFGSFATRLKIAVGSRPAGLALGDVDGDGDLDLVTANEGGNNLSVVLNSGIGWFTGGPTLSAGPGLARVVLADVDGDRDLDLVTNTGLVRLNDGSGGFSGSQATTAGTDVALADVDADGDLDVVISGAGGATLHRNDGAGLFGAAETAALGAGSAALSPVLADVDADGDLDLLMVNSTSEKVHLLFNQRIAPPTITALAPNIGRPGAAVLLTGTDLIGTTTVSFNGTAAPDFTVLTATQLMVRVPAGATTGSVQVINPAGTAASPAPFTVLQVVPVVSLSPARHATVARTAPVSIQFGQALPVNSPRTLAVFSRRGGGLLAGTRTGAGSSTLSLAPAQPYFPGDQLSVSIPGYIDANQRQVEKQVYQFNAAVGGTGRGTFTGPSAIASGSGRPPVLGDVDADGDLDLISYGGNLVGLQLNTGAGTFGNFVTLLTYQRQTIGGVSLGDVDGDGDLDLVASDVKDYQRNSVVYVRFNDGRGAFSGSLEVPVEEGPHIVELVDVDGDGDLDIVTGNSGQAASTTSVRFNDGLGNFPTGSDERLTLGSNQTCRHLLFGDVDNDGDLDMVFSTSFASTLRLNDGTGHFTRSTTSWQVPGDFTALALRDVDLDGDLDLMVLRVNTGLTVHVNDGRGNFPTIIDSSGPVWINGGFDSMSVGDIDADGDPDVAMLGLYNNKFLVMTNNGQGRFTNGQSLYSSAARPLWPVFGDVDNDGDLDIVHACSFAANQVWLNTPGVNSTAGPSAPSSYGVQVYPNPARGQFEVEVPTALRLAAAQSSLQLYNAVGQLVVAQPVQLSGAGRQTLSVAHLPAGLYSLHLRVGSQTSVQKVVLY